MYVNVILLTWDLFIKAIQIVICTFIPKQLLFYRKINIFKTSIDFASYLDLNIRSWFFASFFYNLETKGLIFLSFFSGGIIISSTGSCFSILSLFDLVIASAIFFPNIHLMYGLRFWKDLIFYPIIVFVSFANDKNSYSLPYFLFLGSIDYRVISIY